MEIRISEKLRQLRKDKGNTQEQLALHLGISQQSVGKWERGEGYPDITLLPGIAHALGITIDELLGINYQAHFFRPRGGDERNDQRVHAYVEQMGYDAIAMWNKDGSKTPIEQLVSNIEPGDVYLFHTTDSDLQLLLQFIPAAVQQGYTLVTMSDMFGLPVNEESELTQPAA